MDKPIDNFWKTRLTDLKKVLDSNNFQAFVAENTEEAQKIVLEKIIPETAPGSVSWGGSLTFTATGLYDTLKKRSDLKVLDTFDKNLGKSPDRICNTWTITEKSFPKGRVKVILINDDIGF
ncbi:MAG: LUD domain-containing protein [Deltaproteobacteria bacterium]|nr:LUD domain-containing protein [Deltaproteobacteria bacterium]